MANPSVEALAEFEYDTMTAHHFVRYWKFNQDPSSTSFSQKLDEDRRRFCKRNPFNNFRESSFSKELWYARIQFENEMQDTISGRKVLVQEILEGLKKKEVEESHPEE